MRTRRADGTATIYYYAWKSGPRIDRPYGSPAFARAFIEAQASRKNERRPSTLLAVMNTYQRCRGGAGSGKGFLDLAPRTQADYAKHIRAIERKFGDMPIAALADRRARQAFLSWRDDMAGRSPRQTQYAFTVLARILAWGFDRGLTPANPCERAGRIYRGSRSDRVWTEIEQEAFRKNAAPHLWCAFMLALWTGQRQGDLLRLPWSCYDGHVIQLRQ
ncbi:MAG: hypothetical protein AAF565_05695 [Pseudomonadota bacterium]